LRVTLIQDFRPCPQCWALQLNLYCRLRVSASGGVPGGVTEACPGRGQGGARRALSGARGRACCIAAAAAPLGSSLPTMAAPSPSGGGGSGGGGGTPGPIGPPASGHPAVSSMQGKDGGRAETPGPPREALGRAAACGAAASPGLSEEAARAPRLGPGLAPGSPPRAGFR
jgi:hypothetical protein